MQEIMVATAAGHMDVVEEMRMRYNTNDQTSSLLPSFFLNKRH
jgi:hypothetical protein